jgi:hypothetical protein
VVVFVLEPALFTGETPLVAHLTDADRVNFYEQIIPVSGSLLGFYVAAVAILAQLDPKRKIVQELKRGESFSLLVANMLTAILLLFILTCLGVAGSVINDGCAFEAIYEWILLGTILELLLSGILFGVVTYKVAADKGTS